MSMMPKRNVPLSACDRCENAEKCYQEGRLFGYIMLEDNEVYASFGGNGHVLLRIGETCPRKEAKTM